MSPNPVSQLILEVINQGQLNRLDALVADDYTYRDGSVELHGREDLANLLTAYREAFPDMTIHIDEQIEQQGRVVTKARFAGHHRGDFQGIPATGLPVCVDLVLFSTVRDGRITDEYELIDQLAMFKQLGLAA